MGTTADIVKIAIKTATENAQLLTAAAAIDAIKEIPASYPDGKPRFEYKSPKGKKELTQAELDAFRDKVKKRYIDGFGNAVGDAKLAMNIYKNQNTSLKDRAISWVIETFARVDDPGEVLEKLQAQANTASSAGKSKLAGNKFVEAAEQLIKASTAGEVATSVVTAYTKETTGAGETVVSGLEVVRDTSKFILDTASNLPGPVGRVAAAGSTAIDVAGGAAELLWGDSDKINWEKLVEKGVEIGVDQLFKKFKVKETASKLLTDRLMKTALGKKLGKQTVEKYVAKFIAEEIVELAKATVKELSKNKDMKWSTFLEEHFYKRAQKRFEALLPQYIPSKQREEIVKATGKKLNELMR